MKTQIFQNYTLLGKKEEKILLDSLSFEVDNIFLGLRKADQVIRRELNWLNKKKLYELKHYSIDSIDEGNLKRIIEQMPAQHFLLDEYVAYMLENENNSIFALIKEYNLYLELRNKKLEENNYRELMILDDKLVYYIRNLGAMMYHFNIHLNLLHVFYRNTSTATES
jgi:hypothetical protein